MSNVIQFPTSERLKQVIDEKIERVIDEDEQIEIQKEECVELTHYCFQLMSQQITGNEFVDGFDDMDLLDETKPAMRDMAVIINLLAATFYRHKGLVHPFQEDLDIGDAKLESLMGEINFDENASDEELETELQKLEDDIQELLKECEEDDID